jgi:D-3-phosphoglycerate dehydrogenase
MNTVFVALESIAHNAQAHTLLRTCFDTIRVAKVRGTALEEAVSLGRDISAIIIGVREHLSAKVLDCLPSLKIVGTVSVGMDHIPLEELRARNITLITALGENARSVAEHTLMMILCLLKKTVAGHDAVCSGKDRGGLDGLPAELSGKRVGVLGAGNTAHELIHLLSPFDCEIRVWTLHPEAHLDLAASGVRFVSLDQLFAESDIVTLHIPLTAETKGTISGGIIEMLPKGALLVNTARIELFRIEELDLALRRRPDVQVGIDDFDIVQEPFYGSLQGRCLLSPHIAGVTTESLARMEVAVAEGIAQAWNLTLKSSYEH